MVIVWNWNSRGDSSYCHWTYIALVLLMLGCSNSVLVRGTPFLTMKSSGVYATGRQFIGNSSSIFEAG